MAGSMQGSMQGRCSWVAESLRLTLPMPVRMGMQPMLVPIAMRILPMQVWVQLPMRVLVRVAGRRSLLVLLRASLLVSRQMLVVPMSRPAHSATQPAARCSSLIFLAWEVCFAWLIS